MSNLTRSLLLSLPLTVIAACGAARTTPAEDAFQHDWAGAWCDRQAECDPDAFSADWTGRDACVASRSESVSFASFWGDLLCGNFDASQGDACISSTAAETCDAWAAEDWRDACDHVYGC